MTRRRLLVALFGVALVLLLSWPIYSVKATPELSCVAARPGQDVLLIREHTHVIRYRAWQVLGGWPRVWRGPTTTRAFVVIDGEEPMPIEPSELLGFGRLVIGDGGLGVLTWYGQPYTRWLRTLAGERWSSKTSVEPDDPVWEQDHPMELSSDAGTTTEWVIAEPIGALAAGTSWPRNAPGVAWSVELRQRDSREEVLLLSDTRAGEERHVLWSDPSETWISWSRARELIERGEEVYGRRR